MNPKFTIRKAFQTDTDTIAGFNCAMALETEGKKLDPVTISAGVSSLFKHPEYGFYIVTEIENRVVACLLITYEWSDWRNGLIWWIQSVYVHPDFRRRGIFRQMYSFIKNLTQKQNNVAGIRLYVEKDNTTAQQTYRRLGMTETAYRLYEEMFA
ncbi:MAG TPA: N-acetyltransferase [Candidatus Marinimicrobia bacterium]|nr:N-acetyltransferase [Candidatus Neomarinimicrobiota bacterium]